MSQQTSWLSEEKLKAMILNCMDVAQVVKTLQPEAISLYSVFTSVNISPHDLQAYLSNYKAKLGSQLYGLPPRVLQGLIRQHIPNFLIILMKVGEDNESTTVQSITRQLGTLVSQLDLYDYQDIFEMTILLFETYPKLIPYFCQKLRIESAVKLLRDLHQTENCTLREGLMQFLNSSYKNDLEHQMKSRIQFAKNLREEDPSRAFDELLQIIQDLLFEYKQLKIVSDTNGTKAKPPTNDTFHPTQWLRTILTNSPYLFEYNGRTISKSLIGDQVKSQLTACTMLPDSSLFICGGEPNIAMVIDQDCQCNEIPLMQFVRKAHTLVYVGIVHSVYVFGGYGEGDDATECFDLNQKQWIVKSSMPEPRDSMGAVLYEDYVYLGGGYTLVYEAKSNVYRYSVYEDTFTLTSIKTPGLIGGSLFLVHESSLFLVQKDKMKEISLPEEIEKETSDLENEMQMHAILHSPMLLGGKYYTVVHPSCFVEIDVKMKKLTHVPYIEIQCSNQVQ